MLFVQESIYKQNTLRNRNEAAEMQYLPKNTFQSYSILKVSRSDQ